MNKPIVFSDYHHSALFYSLKLLIEDRLGGTLFRPVGMEWFDRGFWAIAEPYKNNIDTIKQYLWIKSDFKPIDGTVRLNTVINKKSTHFKVQELYHNYIQKAITWDQFMIIPIDILIASIPRHWILYQKLAKLHPSKPKVICHLGNIFWENEELIKEGKVKNLLASVKPFILPSGVNVVFYHQEQPLVDFVPPFSDYFKISSFVHLFPQKELCLKIKKALPEFGIKFFGATCPDGNLENLNEVYQEMQKSDFILHLKPHGDGYGHIWHSAYIVGRPIITNFSDYKDKLGGLLFRDMWSGIDLEKRTFEENMAVIRLIANKKNLLMEMSKNAYDIFRQVVDYEKEEKSIRDFFDNLRD